MSGYVIANHWHTTVMPPQFPLRLHLLIDWDGTLAISSTLPTIAQIGYAHNTSLSLPSWSQLSAAYLSDFNAHQSSYIRRATERKTAAEELSWLKSLREVERKSVERVEAAGIFQNVTSKEIEEVAIRALRDGKVVIRDGWLRLLREVRERGGKVSVVSVGWSGHFIQTCLQKGLTGGEKNEEKDVLSYKNIEVHANEIVGGAKAMLSRYFEEYDHDGEGGIWTAHDKGAVMQKLIASMTRGQGKNMNEERLVVYVGDSTTDLECLLKANIGVCLRNPYKMNSEQKELMETLERIGINCRQISEMTDNDRAMGVGRYQGLWWAEDFNEIINSDICKYCSTCYIDVAYTLTEDGCCRILSTKL